MSSDHTQEHGYPSNMSIQDIKDFELKNINNNRDADELDDIRFANKMLRVQLHKKN